MKKQIVQFSMSDGLWWIYIYVYNFGYRKLRIATNQEIKFQRPLNKL